MEEMTPEQKKALAEAKKILNINSGGVQSAKEFTISIDAIKKHAKRFLLEQKQMKLN